MMAAELSPQVCYQAMVKERMEEDPSVRRLPATAMASPALAGVQHCMARVTLHGCLQADPEAEELAASTSQSGLPLCRGGPLQLAFVQRIAMRTRLHPTKAPLVPWPPVTLAAPAQG